MSSRFVAMLACASFASFAAACGGAQTVTAPVGPPTEISIPAASFDPSPSSSATGADDGASRTRFPAGHGVKLTNDDLMDVMQHASVRNPTASYEERLANARRVLGVDGDDVDNGVAFRGVSAKTVVGPYGCSELVIARAAPTMMIHPADNKHCGLPYLANTKDVYVAPAPRHTVTRLQRAAVDIGAQPQVPAREVARRKLGMPDNVVVQADGGASPESSEWFGIGGRGDDAPITCHVLRVSATKTQLQQHDLGRCGLAWPPPMAQFDPGGPPVTPVREATYLAECSKKCSSQEICLIDRRVPARASLVSTRDELTARWPDGRPAQVELTASCAPIPPACAKLESACFFPRPTPSLSRPPGPPGPPPGPPSPPTPPFGPCPAATFSGYSFGLSPTPHITCYSRVPTVSPSGRP